MAMLFRNGCQRIELHNNAAFFALEYVCISYTHILYIIYYIFGTNFVFWNFAKSQTRMFSLVRLRYLITECIRNALVWEERVLYDVPQSRWLNQQARCLSHVSPRCSITFGLLESSLCPGQPAGQPRTALASKLTGRSDTVVTSVPQMHLLNAEIDISTKAKIFCCMFLSCHYIVSYCKIIVCPNLHYKMFFPT